MDSFNTMWFPVYWACSILPYNILYDIGLHFQIVEGIIQHPLIKGVNPMPRGKTTTTKIGRDARTGRFIPVKEAERRKSTTVVETIKRKSKGK